MRKREEREAAAMAKVMEVRAVHDEMTHQPDATRPRVMVLSEAKAVKNASETHLVDEPTRFELQCRQSCIEFEEAERGCCAGRTTTQESRTAVTGNGIMSL